MSEYKFYKRPDRQINQIVSLQFLAKGIINKEIFDIEYSFIKLSTIYYRIYTYIHIYIYIYKYQIYLYIFASCLVTHVSSRATQSSVQNKLVSL